MHVLTKIFIVLVSLLAVLLVPLVVVFTHNENSFKQRWQDSQIEIETARATLDAARLQSSREIADKNSLIEKLQADVAVLSQDNERLGGQTRKLEADLANATAHQDGIRADIATLAASVTNGQSLIESLVTDNKTLRQIALDSEKRYTELDASFRDTQAALEVEVATRRALQEELQRLNEEHAGALDKLGRFYALYPQANLDTARSSAMLPDRNLTTNVLNVRRNNNETLVEIAAGSRDGIKEGWQMSVFRGDEFIGNLQIIKVDIDSSVGRLSLESQSRGLAQPGDRVQAFAGRR